MGVPAGRQAIGSLMLNPGRSGLFGAAAVMTSIRHRQLSPICPRRSDVCKALVSGRAQVVQVDTTGTTGRVRVVINEGTIYDGSPETCGV